MFNIFKRWPFSDAKGVAVITTRLVLEGEPILLVTHDADDGCWQFLCGTTTNVEESRVVGLESVVNLDKTLCELADLPLGWRAWREAPGQPWQRGEGAP